MIIIVAKKINRHRYMDCLVYIDHQKPFLCGVLRKQERIEIMTKLNINIKVKEFEELAPVIESMKKLDLDKISGCNSQVTVELEA